MAVSVGLVEQLIERIAPRSWAEEWDNPGLLVGSSAQKVNKILLTLDATMEVVDEAVLEHADLIVAHHPLVFKPLKNLRLDNQGALLPLTLFRQGISFYAAHTNLDQSVLSSSLTFARLLGLEHIEYLEVTSSEKLFKIVTFVPEEKLEEVRQALAAEGVGSGITAGEHSKYYSDCFYQTRGEGMFKALSGAEPSIGKIGELTRVSEIKLESIVEERALSRAVKALHRVHPYEEPAYDLIPLKNTGQRRGYGAIGYLSKPKTMEELYEQFMACLAANSVRNTKLINRDSTSIYTPNDNLKINCSSESNMNSGASDVSKIFPYGYDLSSLRIAGDLKKKIKKIAITNGSGGSFVRNAIFKGADLYITGDLDYHGVLDSLEADMAVWEMGHFLSEIPMIQSLYEYLNGDKAMKEVQIAVSARNNTPWKNSG